MYVRHGNDSFGVQTRRGRSAPSNIVLCETGSSSAVAQAVPELKGRLTANAVRVPTPNVSMAVLVLQLQRQVTRDEVNRLLFEESTWGRMHRQLEYCLEQVSAGTHFSPIYGSLT